MSEGLAVTRVDGMDDQARARARSITARREALGMTITDLAHEAGVNRGQLGEYEGGKHASSEPWIRKVENALARIEVETGHDEPPTPLIPDDKGKVVRFVVEGVYGAKALIVEVPPENVDDLERAIDRIMRRLQQGSDDATER